MVNKTLHTNTKNRLRGSKPSLLRGKPLHYGTMGLVNGDIYLRNVRLMLYWQKRNIIVALRRKPDAIAQSPKVKRFS